MKILVCVPRNSSQLARSDSENKTKSLVDEKDWSRKWQDASFVVWGCCHGYLDPSTIPGAIGIARVKAEISPLHGVSVFVGGDMASVQPGKQWEVELCTEVRSGPRTRRERGATTQVPESVARVWRYGNERKNDRWWWDPVRSLETLCKAMR